MHIKGFGKILCIKKLSVYATCLSGYFFKFQAKNIKKNKCDSEQDLYFPKKR